MDSGFRWVHCEFLVRLKYSAIAELRRRYSWASGYEGHLDRLRLFGIPRVYRYAKLLTYTHAASMAGASNWIAIDASSIGSVAFEAEIPGTGVRANLVALLHLSFSPSDQRLRRSVFPVVKPEVEMIWRAVTAACSPPDAPSCDNSRYNGL